MSEFQEGLNMNGYLSIGKVSKLKNVSIKSLRYYDEIGILKPAYINHQTNYRYYTEDQLFILDAIGLCLQLGIPLKDLHRYSKDGHLNLQKLLYDGKVLAEEKIVEIRSCLEKLQNTLNRMDAPAISSSAPVRKPVQNPVSHAAAAGSGPFLRADAPAESLETASMPSPAASGIPVFSLPERALLLLPLDEYAAPKYYGQYILKLFVSAQQLGLTASYPSGILHEYESGRLQTYMCLSVTAVGEQKATQNVCLSWQKAHKEETSLRFFCGCRSPRILLPDYIKADAASYLPGLSACSKYTLLENDILDEELKKQGYKRELLLLTSDGQDSCFA